MIAYRLHDLYTIFLCILRIGIHYNLVYNNIIKGRRIWTTKNSINYEIAMDMLNNMPETKKQTLRKTLERNLYLTSSYSMDSGAMTIYKEGFLLKLNGTRCNFTVFAFDDGELVLSRKPIEKKLNKIYDDSLKFSESDYRNI